MKSCYLALVLVAVLALAASPDKALSQGDVTYRALLVGLTYPGGPAFDDAVAQARMMTLRDNLMTWPNWAAGSIEIMDGGATAEEILARVAHYATVSDNNDFFLFCYHGHGSAVADAEPVPPARDHFDESFYLRDAVHLTDDQLTAEFFNFPGMCCKVVICACCYGRGFGMGGGSDEGDLEKVANISIMAGCSEIQCLPEPPVFLVNLIDNARRPATLLANLSMTVREWYEASATSQNVSSTYVWNAKPVDPFSVQDSVYCESANGGSAGNCAVFTDNPAATDNSSWGRIKGLFR
jgi:hypothetical protein